MIFGLYGLLYAIIQSEEFALFMCFAATLVLMLVYPYASQLLYIDGFTMLRL